MEKGGFLYKRIYEDLCQQIETGKFSPKERLPMEEELCRNYQVSIITVKRALQMLAGDGLVKRIPGKGTFVTDNREADARPDSGKEKASETVRKSVTVKTPKEEQARDKLIGVILEYAMSSFGLGLLYELDNAAAKAGYRLIFRFSYADRQKEIEEIMFLKAMGISGMIILPCHGFYYNTALLKLVLEGFPVVVLDKKLDGIKVPCIRTDNENAVYCLVDYLKGQGRERIGLVTVEEMETITLKERREAFRRRIQELRLPVLEECALPKGAYGIIKQKPIEEYVERIIDYLKRSKGRLDGVVCMEYGNLLAFLEAVNRLRLEWAGRILPCCIDQVYLVPGGAEYPHVKQDEKGMADKAVELLKILMEEGGPVPEEIKLPGIFRAGKV